MNAPARRVVVLGASNVCNGLPQLLAAVRLMAGEPVDFLAAAGHGRSYGRWSRAACRSLPGIVDCGLWKALAERRPAPTAALVTDIGNDLLYGRPPERLLEWVGACVDRLQASGAEVAVTGLPLASLATLGRRRYVLMRSIVFPASRLSLEEISERAYAVNDGLQALAASRGIAIEPPRGEWYGFDPIHIKRSCMTRAWKKLFRNVFGSAASEHEASATSIGCLESLSLRLAPPAHRRLFGVDQRRVQPCRTLRDGTRASFF